MTEKPQPGIRKPYWITTTYGERLRKHGSLPRPIHPDKHMPAITLPKPVEEKKEDPQKLYLDIAEFLRGGRS